MIRLPSARQILNPTRNQWLGGAAALAIGGVIAKVWWDSHQDHRHLPPLPPPPEGTGIGTECGNATYPGFVFDGTDCVPGESTPPGIYVIDDCSDFIFKKGEYGPQVDDLDARIQAAADATKISGHTDPSKIVTDFLSTFWPQCPWPPAPDGPERLVQAYMALVHLVARSIVAAGGQLFGGNTGEALDTDVATLLEGMGYEIFQPEIVPEFDLEEGGPHEIPPPPKPKGPVPGEPKPTQGTFGGPTGPGHPSPLPPPPAECSNKAKLATYDTELSAATWIERKTKSVALLTPQEGPCEFYDLHFGVCVSPIHATFGLLSDLLDAGIENQVIFQIVDKDDAPIFDYSDFRKPLVWKQQYKCRIRFTGTKVILIPTGQLQEIDEPIMDPCGDNQGKTQPKAYRWPSSPGGYKVRGQDDQIHVWASQPSVSLRAFNKTLFADIHYSGLPFFQIYHGHLGNHPQDYGRASMNDTRTTKFVATVKIWAIGIE